MVNLEQIMKAEFVGDIFSNDKKKIKDEYKALSKKWHPDLNGNSDESTRAMSIINTFYAKALLLMAKDEWEKKNYVVLKTTDKRLFEFVYNEVYTFELGVFYVCNKAVIYLIDKKYSSLYDNFKRTLSNLKYPNDKIKTEIERFIPKINLEFETAQYKVIRIAKEDDIFSLIAVHRFYENKIPDKHVAWILSRLYNLSCFLEYNQISHNGLTLESLFINPEHHGIFLYGGWWFSCQIGAKLNSVPKKVYNLLAMESKTTGKSDKGIDLETIRMVGRQLLGDEFGGKLINDKTVPLPLREWLLAKSGKDAIKEYRGWDKTLDSSYGKRVFVKMDINKKNLYESKEK